MKHKALGYVEDSPNKHYICLTKPLAFTWSKLKVWKLHTYITYWHNRSYLKISALLVSCLVGLVLIQSQVLSSESKLGKLMSTKS